MALDYNIRIGAIVDLAQARAQMQAFMSEYQQMLIRVNTTGAAGSTGGSAGGRTGGGLTGAAGGMNQVGEQARRSRGFIAGFTRELGNLGSTIPKVAAFGVATAAIGAFTGAIKDSVGAVVEMDKQLTEFRKVSSLTGSALDDFAKKASSMGTEVARTGSQMVEAATEFRKSGYGDFESLDLARTAA